MASTPRTRLFNHNEPTPGARAGRIAIVAAIIIAPLAGILGLITAALCISIGRGHIKGSWLTILGTVLTGIAIITGQARIYVQTYRDLFAAIRPHSITQEYTPNVPIMSLLNTQVPVAVCLALIMAGIILSVRGKYAPTWNATKTVRPASVARIERAKERQNNTIMQAVPAPSIREVTIPLGIDSISARSVSIDALALRTHGVIIGPTGLGKTQAIQRILSCLLAAPAAAHLRLPAVMIDMKADPDLADYIRTIAGMTGRTAHIITTNPDTSTHTYNPLAGLSADETADSVYETLFANDPTLNTHYANQSRRLLQMASHVLYDLARKDPDMWPQTLHTLLTLLDTTELAKHAKNVSHNTAINLAQYLRDVADKDNDDLGDVRDRVATIINTNAGRVLTSGGLTLQTAVEHGDLVLFSLDAAGSPETARTIGTLAVQDATAMFGRLALKKWGATHLCPVILDEFSALRTAKVGDLYARARSAGGAILLSTQDLDADLAAVSDQFASVVRTNANVWLVLRQTRSEMADMIAGDIGTRTAWKNTIQVEEDRDLLGTAAAASGVGSLREVDEYILHPNQIKSLPQGGAYLIVKVPTGTIGQHEAHTDIHRIHINAPRLATAPDTADLADEVALVSVVADTNEVSATPPTSIATPAGTTGNASAAESAAPGTPRRVSVRTPQPPVLTRSSQNGAGDMPPIPEWLDD